MSSLALSHEVNGVGPVDTSNRRTTSIAFRFLGSHYAYYLMPIDLNMLRLSTNNPRRRLFGDDSVLEQARQENFTNTLKETLADDNRDQSLRWNFDFEREVPLLGNYDWVPNEPTNWVMNMRDMPYRKDKIRNVDEARPLMSLSMQQRIKENETTPKAKEGGESAPMLRKKRRDDDTDGNESKARRRICFDPFEGMSMVD